MCYISGTLTFPAIERKVPVPTSPAIGRRAGLVAFWPSHSMPAFAPRPCAQLGCGVLVMHGASRCAQHQVREASFADKRRGSRQERGYGAAWDKTRLRILARDGGVCQPCLRDGCLHVGKEVDHVLPKCEGGSDDDANLQTICTQRHRRKTQAESIRARRSAPQVYAGPRAGGPPIPGPAVPGTATEAAFLRPQVIGVGGV